MKSNDFFEWCNNIDLSSEINCRNHTSRYYYGLFHLIIESFPDMPSYGGVGTHQSISEYLERGYRGKEYEKNELKKLSFLLRQAKGYRVNADYILDKSFNKNECKSAKASVDRCAAKLNEILASGLATQVQK